MYVSAGNMIKKSYAQKHKELGLCRRCPKKVAEGSRSYCEYHREKDRENGRKKSKNLIVRLKAECLKKYGEKCACCDENLIQFLTLDHKDGDGNIHRKKLFKHNVGGLHMYRWLKANNYPQGFQILCMNCNWATRYGTVCPHKLER